LPTIPRPSTFGCDVVGILNPAYRAAPPVEGTLRHRLRRLYGLRERLAHARRRTRCSAASGTASSQPGALPAGRAHLPDAVEDVLGRGRWSRPPAGVAGARGEPRHFLHSKAMCWVALDRGIRMVDQLRAESIVGRWKEEREALRGTLLEQGWSESTGAFTQSFGDDALDASSLLIPIVGFLPGDDPRVRGTIDAVLERLTDSHGLVYRYRTQDGLDGEEGSFLLCTFWLAEAQALAGDVAAARATFERAVGFANDVGLPSEQVDTKTGELIGNFPQAFSHVGLVNAAWAISRAEAGWSRR
jgi:alpha,alpha-trehalase